MTLVFWPTALRNYRYDQEHDTNLLDKVKDLLEECRRHRCKGTGKPEPLGGTLNGCWSRSISEYGEAQAGEVAQCRYHY